VPSEKEFYDEHADGWMMVGMAEGCGFGRCWARSGDLLVVVISNCRRNSAATGADASPLTGNGALLRGLADANARFLRYRPKAPDNSCPARHPHPPKSKRRGKPSYTCPMRPQIERRGMKGKLTRVGACRRSALVLAVRSLAPQDHGHRALAVAGIIFHLVLRFGFRTPQYVYQIPLLTTLRDRRPAPCSN